MQHLLDMGEQFCFTAQQFCSEDSRLRDEAVFQNLHWGLELVLKAFLHSRGWDDARCIRDVRHDPAKALAECEREGLMGVDSRARSFLSALGPYSRCHRVDAFVAKGADGWTQDDAVLLSVALMHAVKDQMRR